MNGVSLIDFIKYFRTFGLLVISCIHRHRLETQDAVGELAALSWPAILVGHATEYHKLRILRNMSTLNFITI